MAAIHRRQVIGIALIGTAVCMVVVIAATLLSRPALVIDTTAGESTIYLSVSRSETLFRNDCVTLRRDIEHVQAIYLNGEGRTGNGQELFCKSKAVFAVELPDGTTHTYTLRVQAWFASSRNRWLLLVASALLGVGLVCLGWLPGPRRFWNDLRAAGYDARRAAVRLTSESREHLILLLAVMLAGVVLRLVYLPHEISIDEVESFNHYATGSLMSGIADYDDPNNHLLNTLLMHISFKVFGQEVWYLRLPVLVAGILIIPAAYGVARLYYNRETALLTAALVAPAWYLVYMSVNARGYTLQTLLFLLSLALAGYLQRKQNTAAWLLFAVVTALGFFALPTHLYGFAGIAVWLFFSIVFGERANRPRQIRHLIVFSALAGWLTLLLYTPTLARLGLMPITSNHYVRSLSFDTFWDRLPDYPRQFSRASYSPIPGAFGLVVLVAVIASVVFHRRVARHRLPVIVPLLAMPLLFVTAQRVIPYVRVWTYLLPVLYMLAAAGLAMVLEPLQRRWKWSMPVLVIALVIAPGVYTLRPRGALTVTGRPYQHLTVQLKRELRPGDTILSVNPVSETLLYYFRLYHIDDTYFYSASYGADDRLVVVVEDSDRAKHQTLDSILPKTVGMRLVPDSDPVLIAESQFLKAYAIDPSQLRP